MAVVAKTIIASKKDLLKELESYKSFHFSHAILSDDKKSIVGCIEIEFRKVGLDSMGRIEFTNNSQQSGGWWVLGHLEMVVKIVDSMSKFHYFKMFFEGNHDPLEICALP